MTVVPLPNTRVIPAGWAEHHRPVVAGTWTGTCEIRHPGGTQGEFDPTTGTYPIVPFPPHYTGGCRLQVRSINAPSTREAAGEQVTDLAYLVTVALEDSAEATIKDLVTITALDGNGDQTLLGRELRVTTVARATLAWERDLVAVDHLQAAEGA